MTTALPNVPWEANGPQREQMASTNAHLCHYFSPLLQVLHLGLTHKGTEKKIKLAVIPPLHNSQG